MRRFTGLVYLALLWTIVVMQNAVISQVSGMTSTTSTTTTQTTSPTTSSTMSSTSPASTTISSTSLASSTMLSTNQVSTTISSASTESTTMTSADTSSSTILSTGPVSTTRTSTDTAPTTMSSTSQASTSVTSGDTASTTMSSTSPVSTSLASATMLSTNQVSKTISSAGTESTTMTSTNTSSSTMLSTGPVSTTRTSTDTAPTTMSSKSQASTSVTSADAASTTMSSTSPVSTTMSSTSPASTMTPTSQASTSLYSKSSEVTFPYFSFTYPTSTTRSSTTMSSTSPASTTMSSTSPVSITMSSTNPATSTMSSTSQMSTTMSSSSQVSTINASTSRVSTTMSTSPTSTTMSSTNPSSTTMSSTYPVSTTMSSTSQASTTMTPTGHASSTMSSTSPASTTMSSTSPASTTMSSTSPASTTMSSTSPASTTMSSTSPASTTMSSTSPASTTMSSTSPASTTMSSTSPASTTMSSTSPASTTMSSTSPASTTMSSTSPASTTMSSTNLASTTMSSTSPASTTMMSTDTAPTTMSTTGPTSSSMSSTNPASTTMTPTSQASITTLSSTPASTTMLSTSPESTTMTSTSQAHTTMTSPSLVSTTMSPTTEASTTMSSTSQASTTMISTSPASATMLSTSPMSTTMSSTSPASTTMTSTDTASTSMSSTGPTSTTISSTTLVSTTMPSTSQASTTMTSTSPASANMLSTSPTSTTISSTSPASTTMTSTDTASTSMSSTGPTSTTISSTTLVSTTMPSTSQASTTMTSTSPASANMLSTSPTSTTMSSTSPASTTMTSTDTASTSMSSTGPTSTTISSTTLASTTMPSTSQASTTMPSTSQASTTMPSTSQASTTMTSTSQASTSMSSTNLTSTTMTSTTLASTTMPLTSQESTTMTSASQASTSMSSTNLTSTTMSSTSLMSTTMSSTSPTSTTMVSTSPTSTTTLSTNPTSTTMISTSLTSTTMSSTSPVSTTMTSTDTSSTNVSSTSLTSTTMSSTNPSTTMTSTSLTSTTMLSTSPASTTMTSTSPVSTSDTVSTYMSSTSPTSTTISSTNSETTTMSTTSQASTTISTSQASNAMTSTSPMSTTMSSGNPASTTMSSTSPASTVSTSPASTTLISTTLVSPTMSASSQTSSTMTYTSPASTSVASSTITSTSPASTTMTATSPASSTMTSSSTTTPVITTVLPTDCGFPYSYGPSFDFTMRRADEWCRASIYVRPRVPFRGKKYRNIYICPNGIVCFGRRLQTYFIPRNGEFRYSFLGRACLAPYFSDLATYWGGNIYYRYINALDDTSAPEIELARTIVQRSQGVTIEPTFILITTYEEVPHYYAIFYYYYWNRGYSISEQTVTFQVVYITDGSRSYSFYYYKEDGMNIPYGRVFIGLIEDGFANGFTNSRDGSFLRRPDKNLFSGDCYGQYEYIDPESDDIDSELICRKWHSRELNNLWLYNFYLSRMPECPCFSWFLFFDRRFFVSWWLWWGGGGSTFSAYVRPSRRFSHYGKICEYSRFRGTFIRAGNSAGSFTKYHPWTYSHLHYSEDVYYKQICCEEADLCDLYFEVRPQHTCYRRFPFRFSWAFGDPHITTLDSKTYTFNGHDEYVLLNVTTENFQIQCRTDRGFRADGNISLATVFTGFVVSGDGVWMQVELDANRTGLIVYAGDNQTYFDDYTEAFLNGSLSIADDDLSEKLSLERSDDTLMSTFSDLGISFNVTLGKKLLQLGIALPENLENQTEGLLGNFNNNPDDDFIPRYSDQPLAHNSTDRTIFEQFGQTWITAEAESKFKYDDGKTRANYSTDFVPNFIEDADPVLRQQAEEKCGQGKVQCIFDLVFTGDEEVATNTLSTQDTADVVTADAANEVPAISVQSGLNLINGQGYLYTNLKENSSFNVLGQDDGAFSYEILSNSSFANINTETNNSATVTVYLNSTEPQNLSITVVDNQNVYAEAIDVIIVLCTGCSEHGSCDFTTFRQDNVTTETFKIATCNCSKYWEGDDCEIDYDGCQDDPCAVGRNCTDKNATFHEMEEEQEQNETNAYSCGGCPIGYLIDPDDKCEDIDECNTTNGNCSQTCTNTEGSFSCSCNSTYRLGFDGQTCDDINECEEATSGCDQICNNTVGGFECECYKGYIYSTIALLCEQTNVLDEECSMIDCSNADGCTLNSTDDAVCFCNSGYELQNDGSCIDIDECVQNVCSQGCTNTQGSYSCTCYAGFELSPDKVSCEECDFPKYGDNCASTCNCGRGNAGCDKVRGCICKDGWTGTNCDTDINECADANICGDINKICTNTVGSFTCKCRSGYSLQANGTCSDTDECADASLNTCAHQCINTVGGFLCGCRDGYTLDENNATQCLDIDECASGVSACEQTCINTKGSYRCECYFGFVLSEDRKKCTKVSDPCTLFPEVQCSDICKITDQQPVCLCNVGFELGADNQTCIDINECDPNLDLNQCTEKDTCVNIRGKYECTCSLGYQLGRDQRTCTACDEFHWGENCNNDCNCGVGATSCDPTVGCVCEAGWSGVLCDIDRNECASSPGPCSGDNQQCTNTPGSYVCSCLDGYEDIAGNCENINECETATLNLCDQICTDTIGSYACSCRTGFTKNGTACADIDECAGQHGCSQICSNTQGSYRCTCKEGFKLQLTDRRTCIVDSVCDDETLCGINSTCTSIGGVDTCECDKGFEFAENSNTTCIDVLECSINPDQCSQACIEQDGGYTCVCNETGYMLDVDFSTCIECDYGSYGNNCTNNCTCVESNTDSCDNIDGSCTCKGGWTGDTCDTDIDECGTDGICPLNSSCSNSVGSYSCQCNPGFLTTSEGQCQICTGFQYGPECAEECGCDVVNTDSCDPVDGECTCKAGWTGTICTDDIDECVNSTICGDELKTCANTNGSFVCNCIMGYIKSTDGSCGDVDECAEGLGNCTFVCTNTVGSFRCDCPQGQSGSGDNCTDCVDNNYGTNCSTTCGCIPDHSVNLTQTCDPVDGVCGCLPTWTGVICEVDVDECADNSTCNITNGGCHNKDGGYECSCYIGYANESNQCVLAENVTASTPVPIESDDRSVWIYIVLSYSFPQTANLQVQATYNFYISEVQSLISSLFSARLGASLQSVEITFIAQGSLIINSTLTYTDTEDAGSQVTEVMYGLATNESLTFLNETVYPQNLTIGNVDITINNPPSRCELFNEVHGCPSGFLCTEAAGTVSCQSDSDSKGNAGLILGLSLGLAMGLAVILAVVGIAIFMPSRKILPLRNIHRRNYP